MFQFMRMLVPNAIRKRYALKFAIALVLLGVVVGAVGLAATAQVEQEVKQGTNEEYTILANQEANELAKWNERNQQLTRIMSTSETVESGNVSRIASMLSQRSTLEDVEAIEYISLDDRTIEASTRGFEGQSVDSLGMSSTSALDGIEGTENPRLVDVYKNGQLQAVTYAAATGDGHAILLTMSADAYSLNLRGTVGDSGATVVMDSDRNILFDDQFASLFFGRTYDANRAEEIAAVAGGSSNDSAAFTTSSPGSVLDSSSYGIRSAYVVGYAPVEGTDWVVAVHKPQNEAYGVVSDISEYGLYVTGGIVLLIGLVGAVLGRNTSASIDRLRGKAAQMEEGDLNVDFETGRIDNIGQLYAGFASMRDALREQIQNANEAREAAELAQAEAEEMNQHLEQKADQYARVMQSCGDGDFTARMNAESESDAMSDIASEFNEMIGEIETTVERLKHFASEVATASEQVTASSEEVRSASEQVTESIQEISDGAEQQNQSLQNVSGEMESLSTTTEEIAASSNEVADIAERTAETGRTGRDAAEEAIEGMRDIETDSESAVEAIDQLKAEMQQIDELTEFITDLAKETNMLALNANIEASRGGAGNAEGEGEGFAVVAQQVKELAEDTKDAAEDIEERLERIQEQTDETAEEVENTAERVSQNVESVERAVEALDEIAEYAQETNTGVQEISAATEQQAASTQEVVAMVDDAATISEETTSEAENVAAAAEEQTTALTEVSNSASSLSQQASRLSEALDRFDTDASDSAEGLLGEELQFEDSLDDQPLQDPAADDTDTVLDEPADEPTADDVEFEFGEGADED
ncbi:methyl-accepting chemotaxis protein [Haloarchaeobius sp. FL176]|uniref:methyl-accepting chemotaxis protein n=1 Tax=Haloarchaeobius sp. FL176 TaxID=2967129 RepID=UPI002148BF02|nr:methyl-accepting chemotaxis protein [Haloarchaeobius sp. FL176]